ncbi:hypothetical protein [Ferviditalea candida]|uniref:Uncharacterized protein n=1 Tax=Ferviditalea candida TaxID=3108399 RepID=A0ABU5ZPA6_9BACL|nr:hypothetical protein [Paenibacillaceae bacterium T2]
MPVLHKNIREPDPFWLDEDKVNDCVATFLHQKRFLITSHLAGNEKGDDVSGERDGWKVCIESKGSLSNWHLGTGKVFDSTQIFNHLCKQVVQLMQLKEENNSANVIYVMANPDISRIRKRVHRIKTSLDMLGFVQFWVQEDEKVIVECPEHLKNLLRSLDLING